MSFITLAFSGCSAAAAERDTHTEKKQSIHFPHKISNPKKDGVNKDSQKS